MREEEEMTVVSVQRCDYARRLDGMGHGWHIKHWLVGCFVALTLSVACAERERPTSAGRRWPTGLATRYSERPRGAEQGCLLSASLIFLQ